MKSIPFLLRYLLWLAPVLTLAFVLHSRWRLAAGLSPMGDLLGESYLIHAGLAFGIVSVLYALRKRARHLIGFLFIGGSLLKFGIFFAVFYSPYIADGDMDRGEFAAFFLPYVLSLVLETLFTARMLQNLEKEDRG